MKVTKPDDVLFLQGYQQQGGRNFFVATIGYVVNRDGSLMAEAEAWPWLQQYFPERPFDLGMKKRRGTFAVAGKAHAPNGAAVPHMAVRATVGALSKTLHVQGDRRWQRGTLGWQPTAPTPFLSMPIDLEHAFGGKGHPDNPFGRGWSSPADAAEGLALPNIELPNDPVSRPDGQTPVATFGNLYVGASTQNQWLGTFDGNWEAKRFPGFPDDQDDRWFDAVPQDQCMPAFWRGDEEWSVSGMHPTQETLQGKLPGIRPQLVFHRGPASPWQEEITDPAKAPGPEEARFELDTIWLFPNDERVAVLYRALVPVQREDAADIAALGVFTGAAGQVPDDIPQLTEKWLESDFSVMDYLPQALGVLGAVAGAVALVPKIKDFIDKQKQKKEDKKRKADASKQQAAQSPAPQAQAATPAASVAPPAPSAPAPGATPAAASTPVTPASATSPAAPAAKAAAAPAAAALSVPAAASPEAEQWADEVWNRIVKDINDDWEDARNLVKQLEEEHKEDLPTGFGVDIPAFEPPPRPSLALQATTAIPDNFAESLETEMQAALDEAMQTVEAAIRDAMADHPEWMAAALQQLHAPQPLPPMSPADVNKILDDVPPKVRAQIDQVLEEMEASFSELNQEVYATFAASAVISGAASLAGDADTSNGQPDLVALPDDGRLPPSDETDSARDAAPPDRPPDPGDPAPTPQAASASASNNDAPPAASVAAAGDASPKANAQPPEPKVLADQDLRGADLANADYRGAVLQRCDLSGADLQNADLQGANLQDCNLSGANLAGANLQGADASNVDLRGANMTGVRADGATFTEADLSKADLRGASLNGASLDECHLNGTCLDGATLENATLSGVQGDGASFVGSQAQGLRIDGDTRLTQPDFSQATLAKASIQDSALPQAKLGGADMQQAFFRATDLSGSDAQAANAAGAVFKDVRLADASWQNANLMQASFDDSLLHSVDFSGANLYATQTRTADIQGVRLQDSVLDLSQLLKGVPRA